ncbi:hypothetical protein CQW23_18522 [Capsicum baccatum]|uniref:WW domain-containing protein n=1 Tax=Capsicum baccatum TaxID=33114 RepID=A0A2G2W376_CAPBA|nr:hypothetical protein CQW23_18522 [Capsicum baccatum]
MLFSLGQRADTSTNWREFTSLEGRKYYYNKVTRTSKWRIPDEVKLAPEKDTISHASNFGSIYVVKISSTGVDGSLVSAHGAKSSPITVSPSTNLPTTVSSESLSLSSKVSSPMIETVKMINSSEPSSPAVANSEKIGIAVTLGNLVAPPVYIFRFIRYKFVSGLCCFLFGIQFFYSSETTTTQDTVLYGDGFSLKNRQNVKKDAAITEIGGGTPSDEKIVKLGLLVYESKERQRVHSKLFWNLEILGLIARGIRPVVSGGKFRNAWKLTKDAPALRKSIGWRFSSTDTVASVADGGGRGGDASDSGGEGVRRLCGS